MGKAHEELDDTRGCHARSYFSMDLYKHHLVTDIEVDDDYSRVAYHNACASRSYLLALVNTSIFMDKSTTYVDVIYVGYFTNSEMIHEYN